MQQHLTRPHRFASKRTRLVMQQRLTQLRRLRRRALRADPAVLAVAAAKQG
jgi:hypothetical protein